MEHDLELFSPILEILEIEVCNILQNPGNTGNRIFSTSSCPGNIGKRFFQLPHILEIVDRTIHTQSYPGKYDPISALSWKYWKSQFGLGICRDVFTTFVLLWSHPAGGLFLPKTTLL